MTQIEAPETRIDLALEGMTCAACATRIERKLNKLEGVEASVNYATERASVHYDSDRVAVTDLVGAVEAAGYHARTSADAGPVEDRANALRVRLADRDRADGSADRARDDPPAPVRGLGVACLRAGHAGRPLGRVSGSTGRLR